LYVNKTDVADSLTVDSLPQHIPVYWRVRARQGTSVTDWCAPWSFIIGKPAPSTVRLISPAQNAEGVTLTPSCTWTTATFPPHVTAPVTYALAIATTPDLASTVVDTAGLSDTTFRLAALQPQTTYYWHVRAFNQDVAGPWSATGTFTTYGAPRSRDLVAPANNATNIGIRPTCVWRKDPWAETYTVELDTNEQFTTPVRKNSKDSSVEILPALKAGRTYYWHVRGVNQAGDGAWSPTWSFTTTLPNDVPNTDASLRHCALSSCEPSPDHVLVRIVDVQGGTVARLVDDVLQAGSHTVVWNASHAAQGTYVIVVDHREGSTTASVRVLR
jgi:hypothetical protein